VALLVAVGLALTLTFGVRAARAAQKQAAIQRDLAVLTSCLRVRVSGDSICPTIEDANGRRDIDVVDEAAARGQWDRALVVAALGLLAAGGGLCVLAWNRRRQDRSHSPLAAVWRMGESLIALTCLQVLALVLYAITSQLSQGSTLTWERLDTVADNVLALVSLLTGPHF
jgi:hypothetical protein